MIRIKYISLIFLLFFAVNLYGDDVQFPNDPISPSSLQQCTELRNDYYDIWKRLSKLASENSTKAIKEWGRIMRGCNYSGCGGNATKTEREYNRIAEQFREKANDVLYQSGISVAKCKNKVSQNKQNLVKIERRNHIEQKRIKYITDYNRLDNNIKSSILKRTGKNSGMASVASIIKKNKLGRSYFKNLKKTAKTLYAIQLIHNTYNIEENQYKDIIKPLINTLILNSGNNSLIKSILRTSFDGVFDIQEYSLANTNILINKIKNFETTISKSSSRFERKRDATYKKSSLNNIFADKNNIVENINDELTIGSVSRNLLIAKKEQYEHRIKKERLARERKWKREAAQSRRERQYKEEQRDRARAERKRKRDEDSGWLNSIVRGFGIAADELSKSNNSNSYKSNSYNSNDSDYSSKNSVSDYSSRKNKCPPGQEWRQYALMNGPKNPYNNDERGFSGFAWKCMGGAR
jgi:hypothetical protein